MHIMNKLPPPTAVGSCREMESSSGCYCAHRKLWIDVLKLLTMILVVAGHCSYYIIESPYGGINYYSVDGVYSIAHNILKSMTAIIYKFHMPLFMAVSGACFSLSVLRLKGLKDLIIKKVKRLIIPFILVTTFVSVPLKYVSGYFCDSTRILHDIIMGQYLLLGNSHLWFIVSLFFCFLMSYNLEKFKIRKGYLYWMSLMMMSWCGSLCLRYGNFLGLPGMLKHFLYFAAGYFAFQYWDSRAPISKWGQIISWIGFTALAVITDFVLGHSQSIVLKGVLILPVGTVLSFWGIVNMIYLSKSISRCNIVTQSKFYSVVNRYTYELYLYSDPFNYVIIAILMAVFGQAVFTDGLITIISYFARFFGTLICAAILIFIVERAKAIWRNLTYN